jgi:predicted patatin/cPLA2 family phospholipase
MGLCADTGLVLEGGGFRGIFTAAVLDVLAQEDLYFPYAVGVSAGAAYGVSYVSRQYRRNLEVNDFISDPRYCGIRHFLRNGNYFNWEFIYKEIPTQIRLFDYRRFCTSSTRMQVVLTNCETGNAEYMDMDASSPDKFRDLLAATSSLPFISTIQWIHNQGYMDGGIADPIPVQQAFDIGNKRTVVILTRDPFYRKKPMKGKLFLKVFYHKYPMLVKRFIERADVYNRTLDQLAILEKEGKAFVIRPRKPIPVSRLENNPQALIRVYNDTINEARSVLPELKRWLQKPPGSRVSDAGAVRTA